MIPELGQFALILALVMALLQGFLPLYGSLANVPVWIALARPAAHAQMLLVIAAFACLTFAFITGDFSVAYVANHSNSHLPLLYRVSGVWGGHEGSLLLWSLILALWSGAVAAFTRQLPDIIIARVLSVMALISVGFLLFMLLTSNPFERLFPAPTEGRDLNPLLQDIGLAIHPPMLYIGYVGFSVAFAFAIAALIGGRLDAAWARWSRPWTNIAWVFLTIGIALGSWWAYYELGWGGWWFWDPVENASFMPWLVGTALIHSLAATEKRGVFKAWTVLLAVCAFSLSLLGTFLVRSGVLTSVHAFATDPARGLFILIFLGLVSGGSLALYAWRAPTLLNKFSRVRFSLISRETAILINNVFLGALCFTVLTGTLYPLILDALGGCQNLRGRALLQPAVRGNRGAAGVVRRRRCPAALEKRPGRPPRRQTGGAGTNQHHRRAAASLANAPLLLQRRPRHRPRMLDYFDRIAGFVSAQRATGKSGGKPDATPARFATFPAHHPAGGIRHDPGPHRRRRIYHRRYLHQYLQHRKGHPHGRGRDLCRGRLWVSVQRGG